MISTNLVASARRHGRSMARTRGLGIIGQFFNGVNWGSRLPLDRYASGHKRRFASPFSSKSRSTA
ncbi:MAG: hypothetical protein ACLTQI_05595 [Slackia sp.]